MAAAPGKASFTFRDSQGRTARMQVILSVDSSSATLNLQAKANALGALLAAVTNAAVSWVGQAPADPEYGTNAAYPSSQDKAVLVFVTEVGGFHRFQVPAPKAVEFLADGITVDKTETNMAALTAYLIAQAEDSGGSSLTEFIGGFRQRRKLPRRVSSIVLSPKGDTPAQ